EPQVVLVKQPDILDLIPKDSDALNADPPGETGVPLGVVADSLEDGWMDHAAAADLDPTGLLAHRAAVPVALPAAEIDFSAGLRVREEARSKPDADGRREHLACEREQRPFQIGQRQSFAHGEPFDLAERGRVGQVEVVAAVHAPGDDDADWRRV